MGPIFPGAQRKIFAREERPDATGLGEKACRQGSYRLYLEFGPGRAAGSPNVFVSSLSDSPFSCSIYWTKGIKRNLSKPFCHIELSSLLSASKGEGSYVSYLSCLAPHPSPHCGQTGKVQWVSELGNFSSDVLRGRTDPWKLDCSKWNSQASSISCSTNSGASQKCRTPPDPLNQNLHFNKIPRWLFCTH